MSSNEKTALMVLDVQAGLINLSLRLFKSFSRSTVTDMVANNEALVQHYLAQKQPVFIVTVQPRFFTRGMNAKFARSLLQPRADANLHYLVKTGADAFKGTTLDPQLRALGVNKLVLTGYATNNSVYHTAMAAEHAGYEVTVVADASAAKSIDLQMDTFDKLTNVVTTATLLKD